MSHTITDARGNAGRKPRPLGQQTTTLEQDMAATQEQISGEYSSMCNQAQAALKAINDKFYDMPAPDDDDFEYTDTDRRTMEMVSGYLQLALEHLQG